MGILDRFKTQGAVARLSEEAFYAEAIREIESGIRRDGIWAMALAEAGLDQSKAAAKYIKLRVQSLKDEHVLLRERALFEAEKEAKAKDHVQNSV